MRCRRTAAFATALLCPLAPAKAHWARGPVPSLDWVRLQVSSKRRRRVSQVQRAESAPSRRRAPAAYLHHLVSDTGAVRAG